MLTQMSGRGYGVHAVQIELLSPVTRLQVASVKRPVAEWKISLAGEHV